MTDFQTNQRLARLIASGLRCAKDNKQYTKELHQLAHTTLEKVNTRILARFLKAIADENRIRILYLLNKKEMSKETNFKEELRSEWLKLNPPKYGDSRFKWEYPFYWKDGDRDRT